MAGDTNPNRAPALKRPEGMDDQTWTLYRISRSQGMAEAIVESDNPEIEAKPDELVDFLTVSKDAERDALKRYLTLQSTIGRKLAAAQDEYVGHAKRSDGLYRRVTGIAVNRDGAANAPVGSPA